MGAASGKADAPQADAAAVNPLAEGSFQDWTGRLVNMDTSDAPDPKMLNQICDDDPFSVCPPPPPPAGATRTQ